MALTKLQVTVEAASGLPKPKVGIISASPSPYVVIEVAGKQDVRFQTPVVKHSIDPVWNFAVDLGSFEDQDTLQFTLMDSNAWPRSDRLLGKALLKREEVHSNDCRLELALTECETAAKLFLAVAVHDPEVPDDAAETRSTQGSLEETHEPFPHESDRTVDSGNTPELDRSVDSGNTPDSSECENLSSSSNCVLEIADAEDSNDKDTILNLLHEGTVSTRLSASPSKTEISLPLVLVPLKVFGANDGVEPFLAPCLPPPIVYTRTVHAPVVVSAEEFARAIAGAAGAAAQDSTKAPSVAESKSFTDEPQPAKQVKIRKKTRKCC